MKSISRRALTLYALILLFLGGCGLLFYNLVTNADVWAMNKANQHLYSNGTLATAGDITDINGEILATTKDGKRVYNSNKFVRLGTLHTVGDNAGFIASGIQTSFKDELTGYTLIDGIYNLKRYGKGNDIKLTLNAEVCKTAYKALGTKKGTVAVMNYKTGELVCIVSTPTYDVLNKPTDINTDTTGKYDGIYMNRFFIGLYTPGSTFKVLTAACAIENIPDIYDRTFTCKGKVQIGEGYVICNGTHGKVSFEKEKDYFFDAEEENNNQTQTNTPDESVVLPDDCFIIPLPEEITYDQLSDTDNYENLSFSIFIPGNHTAFLQQQKVQNPYGVLKSYTAVYDANQKQTKLTFKTKKIQGYSYEINQSHLLVTIADPETIYDKIIVLDAGHGGIDPGAIKNNVQEKQINFAVINQYAKEYFDNSDIKVYYTRTTDIKIDLYERAAFADKVGADLFISFHVNAHNSSSVNGTSVYYSTGNNSVTSTGLSSSILAKKVLNNMLTEWGTKNMGVLTNNFVVVHYNTVPAILVECAFLTNASDFKKITNTTYQKKAAKAIFDAVEEIFKTYPTKH